MKTSSTLEKAFNSLSTLPTDVQNELGEKLLTYAAQWKELQAGIAQGADELARGEGIEITDVDAFVKSLSGKHGRS